RRSVLLGVLLLIGGGNLGARGSHRHQAVDARLLLEEGGEDGTGQLAAGGNLQRERVHRPAVDVDLVVEVRTGGATGRADVADHLALADLAALLEAGRETAQVSVG